MRNRGRAEGCIHSLVPRLGTHLIAIFVDAMIREFCDTMLSRCRFSPRLGHALPERVEQVQCLDHLVARH